MSRSRRQMLIWVLLFVSFLAFLNPGYGSVYIDGPTGVSQTEKFTFGPGGVFVFSRVGKDEIKIAIEQR